jgi:hypothetical protein
MMDAFDAALTAEPRLHVYHFAPYEVTAMKRLAGRYATRQDALTDCCERSAWSICSRSHVRLSEPGSKATRFNAVREQAAAASEVVVLGRKPKDNEQVPPDVRPFKKNEAALDAVRSREVQVLGGTAWLWADEAATGGVDLLFVDEAGQFSLANALAVAPAADSLVLLGDPRQLAQPQKASHPDGVDVSALAHVLGECETMPSALGVFMPETWRLAHRRCTRRHRGARAPLSGAGER